jgi:hypothetical protein
VTLLASLDALSRNQPETEEAALKFLAALGRDRRFADGLVYAVDAALSDGARSDSALFSRLFLAMVADPQLSGSAMSPLCRASRRLGDELARPVLQAALESPGWFFATCALNAALVDPVLGGLAVERVKTPNADVAVLVKKLLESTQDPFADRLQAAFKDARPTGSPVRSDLQIELACIDFERRLAAAGTTGELGLESLPGAIHFAARLKARELVEGVPQEEMSPAAQRARALIDRYPDEALQFVQPLCHKHWYLCDAASFSYPALLPPKAFYAIVALTVPSQTQGDWPSDVNMSVLRRKAVETVGSVAEWQRLCLDATERSPATLEPLRIAEAERMRRLGRLLLPLHEEGFVTAALVSLAESAHDDNRAAFVRMMQSPPNRAIRRARTAIVKEILDRDVDSDVVVGGISIIPDLVEREDFRALLEGIRKGGDRPRAEAARDALRRMKRPGLLRFRWW